MPFPRSRLSRSYVLFGRGGGGVLLSDPSVKLQIKTPGYLTSKMGLLGESRDPNLGHAS